MKDKIKVNPGELLEFKNNHLVLYASQTIRKKNDDGSVNLIRFWIGFTEKYKVTNGYDTIYEGSQLTHAIAAWESL